jgi:hypothetical protein
MRYFVKCPYCKANNELTKDEILEINEKPYRDCCSCMECFKVEMKLKGVTIERSE